MLLKVYVLITINGNRSHDQAIIMRIRTDGYSLLLSVNSQVTKIVIDRVGLN